MGRERSEERFEGQWVDLSREEAPVLMGVDGQLSVGDEPWDVRWHGGRLDLIRQATSVTLIHSSGEEFSRGINRNYVTPGQEGDVVYFQIM